MAAADVNWFTVLAHHAARTPDKVMTVFEGETTTYREMADRAAALAGGLAARGTGPGDVVALLSYNAQFHNAVGNQIAEKVRFFQERGAEVRLFVQDARRLHLDLRSCMLMRRLHSRCQRIRSRVRTARCDAA